MLCIIFKWNKCKNKKQLKKWISEVFLTDFHPSVLHHQKFVFFPILNDKGKNKTEAKHPGQDALI